MSLRWTLCLQCHADDGSDETIQLGTVERPTCNAEPADFVLSLREVRLLALALQQTVAQQQIYAYDRAKRRCPHCGAYRRIKDWRPRTFDTALGTIHVRVPRVVACMCLPAPLDENGDIEDHRETLCPIKRLLPSRTTPELAYLCARHGATGSYRSAAAVVSALTSVSCLSHMRVRRETIKIGEYIEDRQFALGWGSDSQCEERAKPLSMAIDSTVVTAYPFEEISKFEALAGRIEREGRMTRRFACAIPRRTLARVLVSAALKQCGWSPSTFVDVVNDGASGMRSLVWFHLAMKLHAIRSSLFSRNYFLPRPEIFSRCEKIWRKIREALWRGGAAIGIELTRTLAASMKEEALKRESFYGPAAATTFGAANRLLIFLQHNAAILGKRPPSTVWTLKR